MKFRSAVTLTFLFFALLLTASSGANNFTLFLTDFIVVIAAITVIGAMVAGLYLTLSEQDKKILRWLEILKLNQHNIEGQQTRIKFPKIKFTRQKALPTQYEQISKLKKKIRTFRVVGESDGQIRLHLRQEGWDPQIIELGLRRIK